MVGDTVITGSDDWTARMWSISRGTCDAVLPCHAGPILSVEYSVLDKGIITGTSVFLFCVLRFFFKCSFYVVICYIFAYLNCLNHFFFSFSGSTDGLLRFWENDEGTSIIDLCTLHLSLFVLGSSII